MSLVAGLTTSVGAAMLLVLVLAVPLEAIFPAGSFQAYFAASGASDYLGAVMLATAYVTLAVIGGVLYGIVVPGRPARY